MQKEGMITLYDIVREYVPFEPKEDSLTLSVGEKKQRYATNFSDALVALQIKQGFIKDPSTKQYIFPDEPEIKNTVALLSIIPKNYPDNLTFKDYSQDTIKHNMNYIRKSDFQNVGLSFLMDFKDKMYQLGAALINDDDRLGEFKATIVEVLNIASHQGIADLRIDLQDKCTYDGLIDSHTNGMVNRDDIALYVKFLTSLLDAALDMGGEILEQMEELRLSELEEAAETNPEALDEYEFDYSEQFYTYSIRFNPDTIKKFSWEQQQSIASIFSEASKEYDEITKGKGKSKKKVAFREVKARIKKQLSDMNLSDDDVKTIYDNIIANTVSEPLKDGRHLWQSRNSYELLKEAFDNYANINGFSGSVDISDESFRMLTLARLR